MAILITILEINEIVFFISLNLDDFNRKIPASFLFLGNE